MQHTVYYHPACHTSYSLLKSFNGIQNYAELVDVSKDITPAIFEKVLTVPLIATSGKFVYGGPIDIELAIKYLKGENVSVDVKDPLENLGLAIVDSAAASSLVVSTSSLKPVLRFREFIMAATGLNLDPEGESKSKVIFDLSEKEEEQFIEKWRKKMVATLAYNLIRERLYLGLKPDVDPETVLLWLEAKTSFGRAGVPYLDRVQNLKVAANEIYDYIKERKQKIEDKLKNEIEEIKSFFTTLK
ncbi:MAG: hypothetical protein RXR30_03165 [Nitrososphaeria archaeon]